MEKDTRTEFEKMEAGEMFWNSDAKIGELKKHARRLADRFNATTEDEDQLRLSLLKELFGDCDDDIFIKPPFHCDYGFHIHVGKNFFANFQLNKIAARWPAKAVAQLSFFSIIK